MRRWNLFFSLPGFLGQVGLMPRGLDHRFQTLARGPNSARSVREASCRPSTTVQHMCGHDYKSQNALLALWRINQDIEGFYYDLIGLLPVPKGPCGSDADTQRENLFSVTVTFLHHIPLSLLSHRLSLSLSTSLG